MTPTSLLSADKFHRTKYICLFLLVQAFSCVSRAQAIDPSKDCAAIQDFNNRLICRNAAISEAQRELKSQRPERSISSTTSSRSTRSECVNACESVCRANDSKCLSENRRNPLRVKCGC